MNDQSDCSYIAPPPYLSVTVTGDSPDVRHYEYDQLPDSPEVATDCERGRELAISRAEGNKPLFKFISFE